MPPDSKVVTGVAAVVERNSDYLMMQRGGANLGLTSDGRGTWAFPGGWLEYRESAYDAARRECEEETGLLVSPSADDGFTVTHSVSGFTVVTLFIRCRYLGGEPINREPDKALAVRWMPREFLVELDLFAPTDQWWRRPR